MENPEFVVDGFGRSDMDQGLLKHNIHKKLVKFLKVKIE